MQVAPLAERHVMLTVPRTAEVVRDACREVGHDMALHLLRQDSDMMVFRESWGVRWFFQVEITVHVAQTDGHTQLDIAGLSKGGPVGVQSRYLGEVVDSFSRRLENELSLPPAGTSLDSLRRHHRAVLRTLRVTEWVLAGLLVPVIVTSLVFWRNPGPPLAWIALTIAGGLTCDYLRRRLTVSR